VEAGRCNIVSCYQEVCKLTKKFIKNKDNAVEMRSSVKVKLCMY
jgi:hypothetical protein